MCQCFGEIAVISTGIILCSAILWSILSHRKQQNDNQAVDEPMRTEEDEQLNTCDAQGQSRSQGALDEDQQEKDDNGDDHESNNSEPQSSGAIETACYYLREKCGYHFRDGTLVDTESGKGFIFKGQQDYEDLGLVMNEYIYELLEGDGGLNKKMLGMYGGKPRGFCFVSKDVDTNANGMLVLIHGTGVVRAGQWSRRLIINHSLESGSQMPYIQEAKKRNWSVVVMNTNQRNDYYRWIDGGASFVGFDPEEHGVEVWKTIVKRSPAKRIAIVAHSYGGSVTSCLLREMGGHFKEKVAAIALTDSWCSVQSSDQQYFKKVAKNWVTSRYPVGQSVGYGYDCEHVSAGTTVHEETSWKSFENVFEFIDKKFQASQSNAKTGMDSTSQDAQRIEKVEQPGYQQDARHDFNAKARNENRAENAANTLLASPSGSSEDHAAEQATGDSNIQSTANYAKKSELDNVSEGSSQQGIVEPDANACEKQRGAIVEELNRFKSTGVTGEEFCTEAATACKSAAAGEHATAVAGHATQSSDTRPFSCETTKESRNALAENNQPVADFFSSTTDIDSLVQGEMENQKFDPQAAPLDLEAAKPFDRKFYQSSFGSHSNVPVDGSSDQSLVDPTFDETASMLSQQPSPLPRDESHLKQSLTEADGAGSPATANNTPTSVMAAAEPMDKSNEKLHTVKESRGVGLPECTSEEPGTELATADESPTEQGSISQHAVESAAPVDSEAAKPFDRNYGQSSVVSHSNVPANGSSDQSLVDHTEHRLSEETASMLSQPPPPLPLDESHLKQSLTEADGAGSPATANNTPTSVMAAAEPRDESNDKVHTVKESHGIGLPERTSEEHGTELATADESATEQGSISQHAVDTALGQ